MNIYIPGSPRSGKSSLANSLGENSPSDKVIHLDKEQLKQPVKDAIKLVLSKNSTLFQLAKKLNQSAPSTYNFEYEVQKAGGITKYIENEILKNKKFFEKYLQSKSFSGGDNKIIEGVAMMPAELKKYLDQHQQDSDKVLTLIKTNPEAILEGLQSNYNAGGNERGYNGSENSLKLLTELVTQYSNIIGEQAERAGFPIIDTSLGDHHIQLAEAKKTLQSS